jgi:hypothetical protein
MDDIPFLVKMDSLYGFIFLMGTYMIIGEFNISPIILSFLVVSLDDVH